MKVLVTGGAGFIGSHVVDLLVAEHHEVSVVDNMSSGKRENVNKKAVLHEVDIRDEKLEEVFSKERPQAVVHLAAQISVPKSIEDVFFDESVNVAGTLRVLELMRKYEVGKIVYSSSAAVYGDPIVLPIGVDHPCGPVSPYGTSKLLAEEYIKLYRRMYGMDFTILRYSNVYGPRQTVSGEAGVIAVFIDRIKKNQTLLINGDGRHTRDFIYVEDVARANLAALTSGKGIVVNVSTGVETSLQELADKVQKAAGVEVEVTYGPERSGDILRSRLNPEKAETLLGWEAAMPLVEGLKKTFDLF